MNKRIYTFLATLLVGLTAGAQTLTDFPTAGLDANKVYTISCKRGALQANPNEMGSATGDNINETNVNQQFAFVTDPNDNTKTYLYSVGQDKFLTVRNTWTTNMPSQVYVFSTDNDTYPIALSFSNNYQSNNMMLNGIPAFVINNWGTLDDGDRLIAKEVPNGEYTLANAQALLSWTPTPLADENKRLNVGDQVMNLSDITEDGLYVLQNYGNTTNGTASYYYVNENRIDISSEPALASIVKIVPTGENGQYNIQAYSGAYYQAMIAGAPISVGRSQATFNITEVSGETGRFRIGNNGQYLNVNGNTSNAYSGTGNWSKIIIYKATAEALTQHTVTWQYKEEGKEEVLGTYEQKVFEGETATYDGPSSFDYATVTTPTPIENVTQDQSATVIVTLSELPFTPSTDFEHATWHYWKKATNHSYQYVCYDSENTSYLPVKATKENNDSYKWAFIGNAIKGFKIVNKAAGNEKNLYIATVTQGNDYPTMQETEKYWPIIKGNETVKEQAFDFTLQNGSQTWYINDYQGAGKLGFWSQGPSEDAGSNWIAEEDKTEYTVTWQYKEEGKEEVLGTYEQKVYEGDTATYDGPSYPFTSITADPISNVTSNQTKDAIVTFNTPFEAYDSYENITKWYYWKNAKSPNNKYVYYDESKSDHLPMTTSVKVADNFKWAFIGNAIKGFKIVNKATGSTKDLYIETASNGTYPTLQDKEKYWTIVKGSAEKAGNTQLDGKVFSFKDNNVYMNDYSNAGKLSFWQDSPLQDAGSNWMVEDEVTVDRAQYELLKIQAEALVGTGLNKYSDSNGTLAEALKMFTIDDNSTDEQITAAINALNTAIGELTLNMPKAGTYLRLKGNKTNGYLTSPATNDASELTAMTDGADANTSIWYYSADGLLSYYSGQYMGTEKVLSADAVAVTFEANPNFLGTYAVRTGDQRFLSSGTANGAIDRGNETGTLTDQAYAWTLEEVTELPTTLHLNAQTGKYYNTLYLPVAYTLAEGFTAYRLTATSDATGETTGTASLEAITGTIPANTGVVVVGETDGFCTATVASADEPTEAKVAEADETGTTNLLTGSCTAFTTNASDYFFGQNDNAVGFYKTTLDVTLVNRAYLPAANAAKAANGFKFDFGTTDGIGQLLDNATGTDANAPRYNLQGQRVGRDYKGVVIVGGKKLLVR